MDQKIKDAAVAHVMDTTEGRNYRKHIRPDVMQLIIKDVLSVLNEWRGPPRESSEEASK